MVLFVLPIVDCLGINNDLKSKLQDVLIPERLLSLGHMLGKGMFIDFIPNLCFLHISTTTLLYNSNRGFYVC